jgi:hypothetical protein
MFALRGQSIPGTQFTEVGPTYCCVCIGRPQKLDGALKALFWALLWHVKHEHASIIGLGDLGDPVHVRLHRERKVLVRIQPLRAW